MPPSATFLAFLLSLQHVLAAAQPSTFGQLGLLYGARSEGVRIAADIVAVQSSGQTELPFKFTWDSEEDRDLLKPILALIYPTLPLEVRTHMSKGYVIYVTRKKVELGNQGVLGYSPSTHPDARRRALGLTPYAITIAKLIQRIEDPSVQGSLMTRLGETLTHEVTHNLQFIRRGGPISRLGSSDRVSADGECSEEKLQGTIEHFRDEEEALAVAFAYEQRMGMDRDALGSYLAAHPDIWRGISTRHKEIFLQRVLLPRHAPMKPHQDAFYKASYEPILMVREYKTLLADMRAGHTGEARAKALDRLRALNQRYDEFLRIFTEFKFDPLIFYPYTKKVWPRLARYSLQAGTILDQF